MIPVSVIVATRNEERQIGRCLAALHEFGELIVVDSQSTDKTRALAEKAGAKVVPFTWNGQYPKKRQWCLDNLAIKYDWVFFIDADEKTTPALIAEIAHIFQSPPEEAGFFVKGRYMIEGKTLRFGLQNNKLCLINRHKMEFPVVDDLDIPGMGEIEGHYQPVLKQGVCDKIGQVKAPLLHFAYNESRDIRHERYACWEAAMNKRNAWPQDPVGRRQALKRIFRRMPGRSAAAFLHCYIFKLGILDGKTGYRLARDRFHYYRLIGGKNNKAV